MDAIKEALLKHLLKSKEDKMEVSHEDQMKSGSDRAPKLELHDEPFGAEGGDNALGELGEMDEKQKILELLLGKDGDSGREPMTLNERAHDKMKGSLAGVKEHKAHLKGHKEIFKKK